MTAADHGNGPRQLSGPVSDGFIVQGEAKVTDPCNLREISAVFWPVHLEEQAVLNGALLGGGQLL